jgi:hypothetical protein
VEGFELELSEAELQEITGELQNEKDKMQKIAQPLLS